MSAFEKLPLKVFLCHAHDDKLKTRELYRYLRKRGIQPWLDAEDLVGGQDWRVEIPKAIKASDAIIICLSKNSINKEGFVQAEITFALEKALEIPQGRIFIIPARFEDCEVPNNLERFHWVDLFEEDGFPRLMKSLRTRAGQLERSTVQIPQPDESSPNLNSVLEEKIESEAGLENAEREIAEKAAREKAEEEAVEKTQLEVEEQAKIKAAKEKAERETKIKNLESLAIQYELKGDFWNAQKTWYEIKRIDPLFPHVDIKIGGLERELQPKVSVEAAKPVQEKSSPLKKYSYLKLLPQALLVIVVTIAVMIFALNGWPAILSTSRTPTLIVTSSPTKKPTPTETLIPTVTKTKVPTATPRPSTFSVYDDFSSGSSSKKIDTALWSDPGGEATINWQSGYLVFSGTNGGHELRSRVPQDWRVNQIGKLQADLRIDNVSGGYAFSKIGIDTSLSDGKGVWWLQCRVGSYDGKNAQIICDSYRWNNGPPLDYSISYQTASHPIDFNKFYTVTIEIAPDASYVRYYVDEKQIGAFQPKEKDLLVKADFKWNIGLWMDSGVTATGAIDNVKVGTDQ